MVHAEELDITATIKNVSIDRNLGKAGVIVEIKKGDEVWEKKFVLQPQEGTKIGFKELKRRIEERVLKDLEMDYALEEIKEGKTMKLFQ